MSLFFIIYTRRFGELDEGLSRFPLKEKITGSNPVFVILQFFTVALVSLFQDIEICVGTRIFQNIDEIEEILVFLLFNFIVTNKQKQRIGIYHFSF